MRRQDKADPLSRKFNEVQELHLIKVIVWLSLDAPDNGSPSPLKK